MAETYKVTHTEVVHVGPGVYGVRFEFDDGSVMQEPEGPKETAQWYADVQMGEELPVGVNPLLLTAAKAEKLRRPDR